MTSANTERQQFLSLPHFPGRLNAKETAWFLGFSPHEIPMLVGARLVKPLGHPPEHGLKFFLKADLEPLRDDRSWMDEASDVILDYWKKQNLRRGVKKGLAIKKRRRGEGRLPTEKPTEEDGLQVNEC